MSSINVISEKEFESIFFEDYLKAKIIKLFISNIIYLILIALLLIANTQDIIYNHQILATQKLKNRKKKIKVCCESTFGN